MIQIPNVLQRKLRCLAELLENELLRAYVASFPLYIILHICLNFSYVAAADEKFRSQTLNGSFSPVS